MLITLEKDGEYYRVILKAGTHKLHSEKLNLESAFDLGYQFRKGWTERVFDISKSGTELVNSLTSEGERQ